MRVRVTGLHQPSGERRRLEIDAASVHAAVAEALNEGVDISGVSVLENGAWVPRERSSSRKPTHQMMPRRFRYTKIALLVLLLFSSLLFPRLGVWAAILVTLLVAMLLVPALRGRLKQGLGVPSGRPMAATFRVTVILAYAGALALGSWSGVEMREGMAGLIRQRKAANAEVQELRSEGVQLLQLGKVEEARAKFTRAMHVLHASEQEGIEALLADISTATDAALVRSRLNDLTDAEFSSFANDGVMPSFLDFGHAGLTEKAVEIARNEIPAVEADRAERARLRAEEEERRRQEELETKAAAEERRTKIAAKMKEQRAARARKADSTSPDPIPPSMRLAPARIIADPDYKFGANKLVLDVDVQGQVTVSAVQSRLDYEAVFTGKLPTYLSLNGIEFVLDSHFFNERFPPSLTVDEAVHADFEIINPSQYALLTTPNIQQALADGESATLAYATDIQGKGQAVKFRIGSLELADGEQVARQNRVKTTPESARNLVANAFDHSNTWRVNASRLRAIANAKGDGAFVHIPTFTVSGYKRHPVWFVVEGTVLTLNSPSKALTPESPWARERPDINWAATGFPDGRVSAADGFDM